MDENRLVYLERFTPFPREPTVGVAWTTLGQQSQSNEDDNERREAERNCFEDDLFEGSVMEAHGSFVG